MKEIVLTQGKIALVDDEDYEFINKFKVITGTQKSDVFEINRMPNGETKISIHRKDLGILNRTFTKKETKEMWIYGLDGKDAFIVDGDGDDLIKIKIIGGKKNDAIVVIGVAEYPTIAWVDVFGWSKNEMFNVALRDEIIAMKKLDMTLIDIIDRNVSEHFV